MIEGESEENHMLSRQKEAVTLQNLWLQHTSDRANSLPADGGGLPGGTNMQEQGAALLLRLASFPFIPF